MLDSIKQMLGFKPSVNFKELIARGAIIIDVRTKGEFNGGHVVNSVNIPLDTLESKISKLDKSKTIITCCASGMRSASAKSILESNGFKQVYNGGGWHNLKN
ncbi:MAG: sulfurtransferase [Bacteroidetes bacterium RIFCSPLOWO2_12_FULL_31_6]|nr:MAG: sulfurtransferase [Bacteroidetes bacterium RIFCSPLOWO2_12_FULL_31_6]